MNEQETFLKTIENWLVNLGLNPSVASWLNGVLTVAGVLISCYILYKITQLFVKYILAKIIKKTSSDFDDILLESGLFDKLAYLVPMYFVHTVAEPVLKYYPFWMGFTQKALAIAMVLLILFVGNSFGKVFIQNTKKKRPEKEFAITQYLNLAKIVLWAFGVIVIVSILINKSPMALLGGLTAFMAVLTIVFKDSLLGFVASIQIVSNDLLRIGDWVTIYNGDVDGEVRKIDLVTVKIENWDKTISAVPTYAFVSNSFQNWRGMEDSGVRRIKRSVYIDVNSVKFCTQEMLDKYKKIQYISDYIENKEKEILAYNEEKGLNNNNLPVNGRHQTNVGIFRRYLKEYIIHNPNISKDHTLLIRQLQPTEKGLPIEIYIFSKIQAWVAYEDVQSDIFDHVFAAVSMFDLDVFQNPTGADFKNLSSK
ncbi:mechanosensitive ion channel family protein [Bacteroidales bacterium OttesenSCG-928-C19]|nr:mechanosensitive ion channel family protein [Bacteroidales bacterium OttesenSCG-928-C19]